jgi:SAM-dependent methyltransferase
MKRLLQAYRCSDSLQAKRHLRRWYRSPLGQRLQQTEQAMLEQVLPNLFGFHLLQVGRPMEADLLDASRIVHRMVMDELPLPSRTGSRKGEEGFLGQAHLLPIASDTIDVLLLPHALEYVNQPHEVLREVERVLIPEGHLVILGFNPWGLFGFRRLFSGWRDQSPWCGHFYSTLRLKDWLALLGFETVLVRHYFFRPPMQNNGIMRRLAALEQIGSRFWPLLGGGYLLVAKKRVATLTPIKPRWRSRRRVISVSPAEPSARRDKT